MSNPTEKQQHEQAIIAAFPVILRKLQLQRTITLGGVLHALYRDSAPEFEAARGALAYLCGMRPGDAPTTDQLRGAFLNWTHDTQAITLQGADHGELLWGLGTKR